MSKQKIVIADTAFLSDSILNKGDFVNVFPMRKGDGAFRETLDNLLMRSKDQSIFFDKILYGILPIFESTFPEIGIQNKYFLRATLVSVTSVFLDRAIRTIHRLDNANDLYKKTYKYLNVEQRNHKWISEIQGQTWHLNQEVIALVMQSLGFQPLNLIEAKEYPEFPKQHIQKNYLFSPPTSGLLGKYHKILNKIFSKLENINPFFPLFQNIGLGADRYYLVKKGLIGPLGYFLKPITNQLVSGEYNEDKRNELRSRTEKIIIDEISILLIKYLPQLNEDDIAKLSYSYLEIFYRWYPTSYLEGLIINYRKVESQLKVKKIKGIIGHDVTTDLGVFAGAVAKNNNLRVIGIQHGGHYGYIEDMSLVAQFEFYFYDQMITWGWKTIDDHLPKCETIAMPSPKLSEKPLQANYLSHFDFKNDILFFSNLFHRFPHISTSGQARVDFIDEITDSQEQMVAALSAKKLTIKHKPYSFKFVDLYPEHYQRLQKAGSEFYELLNTSHKGLTVDLIQTCKIVLWDQIGSGTIECFTSEVPTCIYWKRIYSKESIWSRELISDLEKVGVVHSDPLKLSEEIERFKNNPADWMNNLERKNAIKAFCDAFGRSGADWDRVWKKQLKKWSEGDEK